jgi:hypothetical protein
MRNLDLALDILATFRSLPDVARRRQVAAYEVDGPITVYVRASHCRVTVQRIMEPRVQVECDLRQAFGWDWVTDRDDAGVYVVLKRKPLMGALSDADLTLLVPPDAYLVFNLTPGSVQLADFDGRVSVAPVDQNADAVLPVTPDDEPA